MTPRWLLISGDFVPTGGMDSALLGLAKYLARTQPIEVVAHRIAPDLATANVQFQPVKRPAGKHLLGAPLLAWIGRQRANVLKTTGTRILSNGGNCPTHDINWVHYVHAAFPPHSTVGGWRKLKQQWSYKLNCWTEKQIIPSSSVVVCNSLRTANDVVTLLRVPESLVRVVYYGNDSQRLPLVTSSEREEARQELDAANKHRPWVVYVGSLGDVRKGFDTLYNTWKQLVQSGRWDALLLVVGRGAERELWETRTVADGLQNSIRYLGFRSDVPRILAACDLMVHPARYEAYGLGVHEALCRGLPAIVSRSAGVGERYPAELQELLLNDPESVSEFTERLLHWRADLERWPAKVQAFSNTLRSRSWDAMSAELVSAVGGAT